MIQSLVSGNEDIDRALRSPELLEEEDECGNQSRVEEVMYGEFSSRYFIKSLFS